MNCACGMFLFFQVLDVIFNMFGTFFLRFAVVLLTAELNEFLIVPNKRRPCYVIFILSEKLLAITSELAGYALFVMFLFLTQGFFSFLQYLEIILHNNVISKTPTKK